MAQRQFRSDDTSTWGEQFGNGQDGAYTPSTATDAPIDSAATGTADTTSLTATNASFASGQTILIHQTTGTGAGNWELNAIASYTSGTITTKYPLINTYGSGAQVVVLKQYSSVLIDTGVTLTAKAWNGTTGGILGFLCNGDTSIEGTITATAKGYRQAAGPTTSHAHGTQGEGKSGTGTASTSANGQGGGGGAAQSGQGRGSGAGGGHATAGTAGTENGNQPGGSAGGTEGVAGLTTVYFGGGGGRGAASSQANNATATGHGGGFIVLISKRLTITGSISCNGGAGAAGATSNQPGSGGGAGGSTLLKCQSGALGSNLITASGGSGGTGQDSDPAGGAGGVGRIHADYLHTLSGTTSPTIDSRQDAVLADRGGVFLFNMI